MTAVKRTFPAYLAGELALLSQLGVACNQALGIEQLPTAQNDAAPVSAESGGAASGGSNGWRPECPRESVRVGLMDDFEDGNNATLLSARPVTGYWWTVNDGTGQQVPVPDSSGPLATPGGAGSSAYAFCTSGSGFTNWALLGVSMLHLPGVENPCPIDASGVRGVRFDARGPGRLQLHMAIAQTELVAYGGRCADTSYCSDHPRTYLELGPSWASFSAPWEAFAFGGVLPDAREIIALGFGAMGELYYPEGGGSFDFCVDNVEFY